MSSSRQKVMEYVSDLQRDGNKMSKITDGGQTHHFFSCDI